tara:strand:+ start:5601 stop:6359 length:759 start_codon:yes stop_codon:yes gene_type:complete
MALNSKILLSRYNQARKALREYSLGMLGKLGSGRKSRSLIRKFNVMSMWIDYIGNTLDAATAKEAIKPSDVTIEVGSFSGSGVAVLYVETITGKTIPLCMSEPVENYESLDSVVGNLVFKINRSSDYSYLHTHLIKATRKGNSIILAFPKGALFNNAVAKVSPNLISITSTKASGGVETTPTSVSHTDEIQDKIEKIIDTLAIELRMVYKTDNQRVTESLIDGSRAVARKDSRIILDRGDSLSDENNRNLEL